MVRSRPGDCDRGIAPTGEIVFHLGNVLVTVNDVGNFIAVEPGDGFDWVMEMDFEGNVKWSSQYSGVTPMRTEPRRSRGRDLGRSSPLLEEAPRLLDEVVEPLVAAVYVLAGARHGVLDILNGEESGTPPVRGAGFFFWHTRQPLRWPVGAVPPWLAASGRSR